MAVSSLNSVGGTPVEAKEHSILVLPSGGATGIIPATLLTHLEERTGKPVYQLFDEIWSSSIGAVTAALLTTPREKLTNYKNTEVANHHPMSAREVSQFIEQVFSRYHSALRIRKSLKKLIPSTVALNETLIPIRILSAEVTSWGAGIWPSETKLKDFSKYNHGSTSLTSVACGSCTVFPLHPRAEQICLEGGQISYCIDAGAEICTESSMNPLWHFLERFLENIGTQDSVALYFLSNGWVRLPESWNDTFIQGTSIRQVKLFNVDVNLEGIIQNWKSTTYTGKLFSRCENQDILFNLAGSGAVPIRLLKEEAEKTATTSDPFLTLSEYLKNHKKDSL